MENLHIRSPRFEERGRIPEPYSDAGGSVSPPLLWSGVPRGTKELALIVDDPDAPGTFPFVHWVAYKIPADWSGLPEGASGKDTPGFIQGTNSTGEAGYFGPAPPRGATHRYSFHLYALDHSLDLEPGLDKRGLRVAMEGHILSEAVLVGVYS
jgi:Raf kinase inhibitor-like YbhB/YbcL family protein